MLTANKTQQELIERYLRNGVQLVLDGYHPERIEADKLKAMGFTWLRLAPELYRKQETANAMTVLRNQGFKLLGGGADSQEIVLWLTAAGVTAMSGTVTGVSVGEDDLIRDSLARER